MERTHWTIGLVVVAAVAPMPAQDLRWQLPPLGAIEYRRTWHAAVGPVGRTAGEARGAPANGKLPDRWLPRLAPAPWLCAGELRDDGKAIGDPVRDLRDVARAVAFDLGNRGALSERFPRVVPFGDLAIAGAWTSPDPTGAQSLRATVTARRPAALAGDLPDTALRLRPFCFADAGGTLAMTRRIDVAAGRVAAFTAEFDLVVEDGDRRFRRLVVKDEWHFVAVRANQDADFRTRVAAAIRLGVAFVRAAIEDKKSFLVEDGEAERSYDAGRLALALLTLHGNVPADDPVVARGFDDLRRKKLVDTYSLATALMAMAARHAPPREAERIRDGELLAIAPRALDERDKKLVEKWVAALLKNVDPRVDAGKLLRFNYVAGPRYDTSLQQYGLLGLWAAHTCGVEVPGPVFAAAARQLLAVQAASGPRGTLRLATFAQLREVAGTDSEPKTPELRAQRRGFAYEDPDEPPYGSMTSAGISGLLLARAGMRARGHEDRALEAQIDDAVRDAYAWLAAEFTVRANPGFAERADHHWYYWLYGLERSCELNAVARLNGRDWYYEGALQLLAQQQPNGSFRTEHPSSLLIDATCFAVLFLDRATVAAAVTGR